jgi:hypothetical protein
MIPVPNTMSSILQGVSSRKTLAGANIMISRFMPFSLRPLSINAKHSEEMCEASVLKATLYSML